jgi:hypothetical protein
LSIAFYCYILLMNVFFPASTPGSIEGRKTENSTRAVCAFYRG